MPFEQFGSVFVFRPSLGIEQDVSGVARQHLRSKFQPGEYRGAVAVNAILHHQFKAYMRLLRPLIPKLCSRGAIEFLLSQYDEAGKLLHGNGILDLQERERWKWIEPRLKRAIKFLVESVCMAGWSPKDEPRSLRQTQAVLETALVCAECLVDLAMQSDVIHSVFPYDCVLRVFDSGPYDFTVDVEGNSAGYSEAFWERVDRDRNSRHRFVPIAQFDYHTAGHQLFLDMPFKHEFGMSYGEFIAALMTIINESRPSLHPKAFPTLFLNREHVINELARSGRDRVAIERAINGFSIRKEKLLSEQRVVWKPKQENRAYRRGFFVLPHEDGPHLAFSREMARENLFQLVNGVAYRRLPEEWRTKETTQAANQLSKAAGDWFEKLARQRLGDVGFVGDRAKSTIGRSGPRISIPQCVGEIDFIGYNSKECILLVAEAKMALTGLEAAYWRDDLHEFVYRRGSYADHFRRKLEWVIAERSRIAIALGVSSTFSVCGIMLTLYPCIARAFIPDFPCVSITELMLDYERAGSWPYAFN